MIYLATVIGVCCICVVVALGGIGSELKRSNDLKEKELNKNNNSNQSL